MERGRVVAVTGGGFFAYGRVVEPDYLSQSSARVHFNTLIVLAHSWPLRAAAAVLASFFGVPP